MRGRGDPGEGYYVLARNGFLSSQGQQGITHGQQAVSLLEQTEERWWLGQPLWVIGANHWLLGEFAVALEVEARTHAIGDAIEDPRLQTYAGWTTGLIYANMGDWQAAIEGCQHALARSPDPINTAAALGLLGYAYLEKGDATEAILLLEQSVQQFIQFRYRPLQGLMMAFLGEAQLLEGDSELARDLVLQGLKITREVRFWYVVGYAQRLLGRIAQARGRLVEAERHLQESLETSTSIQSQFEVGRTHRDLASLAFPQGKQDDTTTHLNQAYAWFKKLQVPKWVERTAQLAHEYGVTLQEVELEELLEEPS